MRYMISLHKCIRGRPLGIYFIWVLEQYRSYFSCNGELQNFGMRQKIYFSKLMETPIFPGIYLFHQFIFGQTPSFKTKDRE